MRRQFLIPIMILLFLLSALVACARSGGEPEASGTPDTSGSSTAAPESSDPIFKEDFESGETSQWKGDEPPPDDSPEKDEESEGDA